jgi:hypothetical protein
MQAWKLKPAYAVIMIEMMLAKIMILILSAVLMLMQFVEKEEYLKVFLVRLFRRK